MRIWLLNNIINGIVVEFLDILLGVVYLKYMGVVDCND